MKDLARKTRFTLIIYSELIAGILCYVLAAAVTGLLIRSALNGGYGAVDDVAVVVIILAVFYLLCLAGGGILISQFFRWKKLPDTLISADSEYLYIYARKEEKIALSDVISVFAGPESFLVHLIGGGYGTVEIETVGKKYKVYFANEASSVPDAVVNPAYK